MKKTLVGALVGGVLGLLSYYAYVGMRVDQDTLAMARTLKEIQCL